MQTPTISTKPMLYSNPMVVSILNDTKNQTRRIVKGTALKWLNSFGFISTLFHNQKESICPYGKIGDTIWVKETYYAYGYWQLNGVTKNGKQKWKFVDRTFWGKNMPEGGYKYEDCKPNNIFKGRSETQGWYKRPSLFMPKIASRITLQITDIKAERLQDISSKDAVAEGIEREFDTYLDYLQEDKIGSFYLNPVDSYETLWQKINGPESWQQNPWVWVIKFKRL